MLYYDDYYHNNLTKILYITHDCHLALIKKKELEKLIKNNSYIFNTSLDIEEYEVNSNSSGWGSKLG